MLHILHSFINTCIGLIEEMKQYNQYFYRGLSISPPPNKRFVVGDGKVWKTLCHDHFRRHGLHVRFVDRNLCE